MKTRVLILINHISYGGAARIATLWAEILADANYDVTVLTHYPSLNEYKLCPHVKRINLVSSYPNYLNLQHKKTALKKLFNQYLVHHPQDVIIPFLGNSNLLTASTNQTRCEIFTQTIRNSPWDKEYGFKLILRDWAIRRQGSVILQNNEQAEYFNSPEYKHVKKYIVHNPLNPEILKIKKESYQSIKKIVAVGRLSKQKNYTLMIEAIRILRDEYHENYELDIYGDGELKDDLQSQINQYNLDKQIKLCGHNTDIFNILINYDLFLMTSLYEGTPNALLEAMGLGLPSLAIKCRTGITELIDNGKNGYILESYDAHDLAKKIHLINNQTQLEQIGKQARQDMINRYSPDKIQTELISVIEDLHNNPPKITEISLNTVLKQQPQQTQLDFQNYFELSLEIIKLVDREVAEQIFHQTKQTLQNITIDLNTKTQKIYFNCLLTNQFNQLYENIHIDKILPKNC